MQFRDLGNGCFSDWWAKYAKGEQLIVQPKFDGCGLGLRYQSGTLVAAYTKNRRDVLEAARNICNVPLSLPEDGLAVSEDPVEICGELYGPTLSRSKSQGLAAGHLKRKNPTGSGLSFVAFEILGSCEDEIEDIKKLESWFFEIPPTNRTTDPRQVKQWYKEWLSYELFGDIPTDGIVVKINSGLSKQKIGINSKTVNWALALK